MKRITFFLMVAALAMIAQAAETLNVVVTLPDLAAVAAEVGGPFIHLSCLANPAEDPHFVDPKPSFAKLLNKADLLIEGGAELEVGWLPPIVQNARNAKILPGQPGRFVASQGIQLKEVPSGPVDRSQGDVHPSGNPHYMMDPVDAAEVAMRLAGVLGRLDQAHAAEFQQNAKKFADEINKELAGWTKRMEPFKGQKVITYHKSFTYFMDRFGMELFDTIEPKPGIEPSPSHIAELIKRARGQGIKLVLIEENRPRKTPERVAHEIGAKVVILHHMPETTGPSRYVAWIRGMIEALEKAQ
jgi:zinc/manganese transport system substrate-binding protein